MTLVADICVKPINNGPNRGKTAKGTAAGYRRHLNAGEQACRECLDAAQQQRPIENKKRKSKNRYSFPEPLATGLPRRKPLDTPFVPSTLAVCTGCGARGLANSKLLGTKAKVVRVEKCRECR